MHKETSAQATELLSSDNIDRSDRHDYLNLCTEIILMKAQYLEISSESLVKFGQNLLDSTRAQLQED